MEDDNGRDIGGADDARRLLTTIGHDRSEIDAFIERITASGMAPNCTDKEIQCKTAEGKKGVYHRIKCTWQDDDGTPHEDVCITACEAVAGTG